MAGVLPGRDTDSFTKALDATRSPRQILQWWGTEHRRAADAAYWTHALTQRIAFYRRTLHEKRFVITDCRFANEAQCVRKQGGRIWQIKRPGIDSTAEGTHASATDGSVFLPQPTVNNCHDIRHLQQIVLAEVWGVDAGLRNLRVEIET